MKRWLLAQARAAGDVWRTVRRSPVSTLFSVVALATALALPVAGVAVLQGMERVAARFDTEAQISLFLAPAVTPREREALARTIRAKPGVKSVRVVTREQALAELQATEGVRDLLAGLPGNPLPDSLVVRAAERRGIASLSDSLSREPGVASIQADVAWVERLEALLEAAQLVVFALAVLLGAGVVAVTFNTIRLQVLTRAEELEIASLVGATRAWQRRPFLYFGVFQGVTAGLLCAGLVAGLLSAVGSRLEAITGVLGGGGGALHLPSLLALTSVLSSAVLGWIGAWAAVHRHLRGQVPR